MENTSNNTVSWKYIDMDQFRVRLCCFSTAAAVKSTRVGDQTDRRNARRRRYSRPSEQVSSIYRACLRSIADRIRIGGRRGTRLPTLRIVKRSRGWVDARRSGTIPLPERVMKNAPGLGVTAGSWNRRAHCGSSRSRKSTISLRRASANQFSLLRTIAPQFRASYASQDS